MSDDSFSDIMNRLPMLLLRDREAFWNALRSRELTGRELMGLAAFIVVVCAL